MRADLFGSIALVLRMTHGASNDPASPTPYFVSFPNCCSLLHRVLPSASAEVGVWSLLRQVCPSMRSGTVALVEWHLAQRIHRTKGAKLWSEFAPFEWQGKFQGFRSAVRALSVGDIFGEIEYFNGTEPALGALEKR